MKNSPNDTAPQPDLAAILRADGAGRKSALRVLVPLLLLALAGGGAWYFWRQYNRQSVQAPAFGTEPIRRGDIRLVVQATGNLEPTNEVTVGSELSGTILEVYVETNDHVTAGQPLAKLDTTKLQQQTAGNRASVNSAKSRVIQAEATLKEAEAALARHRRLHELSGGKVPSEADMDTAIATADRARADLAVAQASLTEAEAQLSINETDLGKAIIKSPLDGIVLTRDVEPGQTVAASLNAPELFVIAEKLEHMKLIVAVAEADIGRLKKGQNATFAVVAWPNRTYTASVLKVSYASAVTDNVVTYETELEVRNDDLSLRPGMTATADIHAAESKNTLLVPSAALRFNPESAAPSASAAGGAENKSFVQSLMPGPPRRSSGRTAGETTPAQVTAGAPARIWILREGTPVPTPVSVGLTSGSVVEVSGEGLEENLPVITRPGAPAR